MGKQKPSTWGILLSEVTTCSKPSTYASVCMSQVIVFVEELIETRFWVHGFE